MSLASELAGLFEVYGYTWAIDGELKVPTESDIEQTLDKMSELMYAEDSDIGSIEVGRILMRRDDDHTDVFLFLGELNDKDS